MVYPRGLLRFGEEQQPQVCTGMSFRHCNIAVNHCDGKNPPRKAHQSTKKPLAEQCPPPLRQHHGNQPAPAKFQPYKWAKALVKERDLPVLVFL